MIILSIVAFIGAIFAIGAMQIECPYCHNSDRNVKGMCVLQQKTGYCSEDYYDQHYNKTKCPWCSSSGHMSRWDAWMD